MTRGLAAGEIVLEDAWRLFSARGDRGRTLKELVASLTRRRVPELPPTQALAGVSLRIAPGETVGIVGRNGAGKTSMLRVLAGIIPLQRGYAACGGQVATLIELGAGFGREFTGRENIHVSAALHGMSRTETEERIDDIIAFSELGHFIDAPIKTYSSGMLVRLGFSIAAHLRADVLLVDEVLAVGDEAFQRKCLRHIIAQIEQGLTVVLVSHAPATIERVCRRAVVLDAGRVAFDGPAAEALLFYHRLLGIESLEQVAARQASDKAVALSRATLEDAGGRPRQVFEPGEAMRLVLDLDAPLNAPEVTVAIEVRHVDGRAVFRTQSPATAPGGSGQLVFDVPRLTLLGGDYDLAIAIHEPSDTPPGIDRLLTFSVVSAADAEGIADLRGTWTVTGHHVETAP
ncbi:MAG: ABC transporter ATP-binding protein [Actinobacteria bacterium]|nr:MAG: ABC transporter ATP-binding protein [Actinomycetota bacterium]